VEYYCAIVDVFLYLKDAMKRATYQTVGDIDLGLSQIERIGDVNASDV